MQQKFDISCTRLLKGRKSKQLHTELDRSKCTKKTHFFYLEIEKTCYLFLMVKLVQTAILLVLYIITCLFNSTKMFKLEKKQNM